MKLFAVALMFAALLVGAAVPAAAAAKASPSQTCAANGDAVTVQFGPGESDLLPIPSHGGCVSTVAAHGDPVAPGDYSHAAFVAQCKLLESELPAELWNAPVDIIQTDSVPENIGGFGGKIETCTWLLQAYHSGTLTHPE